MGPMAETTGHLLFVYLSVTSRIVWLDTFAIAASISATGTRRPVDNTEFAMSTQFPFVAANQNKYLVHFRFGIKPRQKNTYCLFRLTIW